MTHDEIEEKGYDYLYWLLTTPVHKRPKNAAGHTMTVATGIYCNDGAYVSVQGGHSHYSAPRSGGGHWYEIEAGFPSVQPPDSWAQYAEEWEPDLKRSKRDIKYSLSRIKFFKGNKGKPGDMTWKSFFRHLWGSLIQYYKTWRGYKGTNTIYAYMPIELVVEFIDAHGGENTERCFQEQKKWIKSDPNKR